MLVFTFSSIFLYPGFKLNHQKLGKAGSMDVVYSFLVSFDSGYPNFKKLTFDTNKSVQTYQTSDNYTVTLC